ncbi:alpha/beta hydrolase [Streptomyces antioxidans]|uniref:Alpha/beta hydrolase n=1 Tax=Streptomyces antioxidans TaxID=1507734 RepID=A0A1V4CV17_9ACTN|nr:alpha/beta hydrolase [Streptomyces antioxidans]OPF71345.1 alpha/beta hydrolase [Streptomyces antioxidans]
MTELKYINANGLDFGYFEAGPADAPLALCLHGFPDSAHSWRHLLPALADAGYHAVAPFMRGYAPSGIPADGAYQAGAIAADANALHEAFGGDGDAVLIGHDWGAIAAYGATGSAPERWRRAVTMAVPPLGGVLADFFNYDYGQFKRSFYIFLFQTPLAEAGAAAHDMALIDGLWRDWSPGYKDAAEDIAHVKESLRDPDHLAAAIGYYRALFDPTRHVAAYAAEQEAVTGTGEVPTLYLHGADDGCIGADVVQGAVDHLPAGSRMELVDDTGHFLHLERPERINREVLTWLAE